ncbi:MAG: DUF421 domain-containing protein [Clostridia bacterium]|nr:DUF421 domain-containing protein [Clostridia bacterium]
MTVIFVRSIIFFVILTFSMRLMGKRQIGEIELTEFVTAVMLSELAALPVTDTDIPLTHGIAAVGVLVSLEIIVAFVCRKSPAVRGVLDGKPLVLVAKGRVLEKNLTAARISTDELFASIRGAGLIGIDEVGYVILEQTGALSVIPAARSAPVTPSDMGLKPDEKGVSHGVIIDGRIQKRALHDSGKSEEWLKAELEKRRLGAAQLLYFCVDDSGNVSFEKKSGR